MPIYTEKGDVTNCGEYRGVKFLKHRMKIIRVLEKRIRALVVVDDMQFGFMSGRGMTDALFIVRRMQKNTGRKIKSCTGVLWI